TRLIGARGPLGNTTTRSLPLAAGPTPSAPIVASAAMPFPSRMLAIALGLARAGTLSGYAPTTELERSSAAELARHGVLVSRKVRHHSSNEMSVQSWKSSARP